MNKKNIAALALLFSLTSQSFAASFQSYEQSATLLGTANAGTTVTDDPSIQFYNPAGMAFFKNKTLGLSAIGLQTSISMSNTTATGYNGRNISGSLNGPGTTNILPAFYFILPANQYWSFGMGVTVPFGLETLYSDDSIARYFATRSRIMSINLNPSVAYKINPHIALGIGFDMNYAKTQLDQAFDFQAINPLANYDLLIRNTADSWAPGWNAGIYFTPMPATRVGLGYHSKITHHLSGHTRILGYQDPVDEIIGGFFGLQDSSLSADLTLPAYMTLSASQQMTSRWTLMSDISYIQWSALKNITLTFTGNDSTANSLASQTLPLYYRNTWRFALGSSYRFSQRWTGRLGIAYDQSPVRAAYRDARLPDNNHIWLSIGGTYHINEKYSVSMGYAHIFIENSHVNQNEATALGNQTFSANYKGSANLFGLQLNISL